MKNNAKMMTMKEIGDVDWKTLYAYSNRETGEVRALFVADADQPYFLVVEVEHGKVLMFNISYGDMMLQDWWAREDYLLEKDANKCTTREEWEKYDSKSAECWEALHKAQKIVEERKQ